MNKHLLPLSLAVGLISMVGSFVQSINAGAAPVIPPATNAPAPGLIDPNTGLAIPGPGMFPGAPGAPVGPGAGATPGTQLTWFDELSQSMSPEWKKWAIDHALKLEVGLENIRTGMGTRLQVKAVQNHVTLAKVTLAAVRNNRRPHPVDWYNLGVMYTQGLGVPLDLREAFRCFKRAAEHGLPAAQFNLARAYSAGQGTSRNRTEAYRWWTLAALAAHPGAAGARDYIAQFMSTDQIATGQRLARAFMGEWNKHEKYDRRFGKFDPRAKEKTLGNQPLTPPSQLEMELSREKFMREIVHPMLVKATRMSWDLDTDPQVAFEHDGILSVMEASPKPLSKFSDSLAFPKVKFIFSFVNPAEPQLVTAYIYMEGSVPDLNGGPATKKGKFILLEVVARENPNAKVTNFARLPIHLEDTLEDTAPRPNPGAAAPGAGGGAPGGPLGLPPGLNLPGLPLPPQP